MGMSVIVCVSRHHQVDVMMCAPYSGSIISKKAAEGVKCLVLDVKFGSGAFMADPQRAEQLARTMVRVPR